MTNTQKFVAEYLRELHAVRPHGTAETSHYPALTKLLNAIGGELKPKVNAISQLKDLGCGMPDYGLFTREQMRRNKTSHNEKPGRGVVEVKKPDHPMTDLIHSDQTRKYAAGYGTVLATNYWQFCLLAQDGENNNLKTIAEYEMAQSPEEFWAMTQSPQKTAAQHGTALSEFLRRAMEHDAPIESAQDIARILASFAREALFLLEHKPLAENLRNDLENALSMKFDDAQGKHFFHSTLAQTIFYGLFAAWLETDKHFDWRSASYLIKTPVVGALFHAIMSPDFSRSGFERLLDGATAALNRVSNKDKVLGGMDTNLAIQHFYEPFLAQFDPVLRREMGVWYTPPEIVRYMVERTDRVLRNELGIDGGLAADNVRVLDPCGGTGAFVAEILRRIQQTCQERGDGALSAQKVKNAAMRRIFSFEILPSSYIVAHWQVGALLKNIGAPLADGERAAIYLTNSLTNWDASEEQMTLNIAGLGEERDAANKVKREQPILVIIGNPPYNAFAGVSPAAEDNLVAPYKEGLIHRWNIKKFNLDDLYLRFFRMAENRINKTGRGIVSFISNYSYTCEPSFVVMRQSLLKNFDKLWIENMHGNRNITERAPDGSSSNTIFAMRGVSPGIRQGIVIALAAKLGGDKPALVRYRNDLDAGDADERRAQLLNSLDTPDFDGQYEIANPQEWNKFSFCPNIVSKDYLSWPSLKSIGVDVYNGPIERRGMSLIRHADEVENMINAISCYLNPSVSNDEVHAKEERFMKTSGEFDAIKERKSLLDKVANKTLSVNRQHITQYPFKPFDMRVAYLDKEMAPLFSRPSPELLATTENNWFIIARNSCKITPEGAPLIASTLVSDYSVVSGAARHFPIKTIYQDGKLMDKIFRANLSKQARKYLADLGFAEPDHDSQAAEIIWLHALAIGYSAKYQSDNADGLKIDWPRIPLPQNREILEQSAALGARIKNLLSMTNPADDPFIINELSTPSGDMGNLQAADYWGYRDGKGKVYPGVGKTENSQGKSAEAQKFAALGIPLRVYLNDGAYWDNVPSRAWEYRIGGFQVAKKWLSYRAGKVLGRALTDDEVLTFADIIRRLSALLLLAEELDGNYDAAQNKCGLH